jgi:hypothetical protein
MPRRFAIAAALAGLLAGLPAAGQAREPASGVTVLRGNTVTPDGTVIGVGTGGPEVAPANAAAGLRHSGTLNALFTGSANAGGEIGSAETGAGR